MIYVLHHISIAIAEFATLSVVVTSPSASWLCGLGLLVIGRSLWSAADHIAELVTKIPKGGGSSGYSDYRY